MVDEHRAPEESDHQAGPSGEQEADHPCQDGRPGLEPMQPHQLGIACEILDLGQVGGAMLSIEHPADMTVEKAVALRRMHVLIRIGISVVLAMLSRPPQHALLRTALGQERQDELEQAGRGIGAVRKVAVIAGADREDSNPVERQADQDCAPSHPRPDHRQATDMRPYESNGGRIDDVVAAAPVELAGAGLRGAHPSAPGTPALIADIRRPRPSTLFIMAIPLRG